METVRVTLKQVQCDRAGSFQNHCDPETTLLVIPLSFPCHSLVIPSVILNLFQNQNQNHFRIHPLPFFCHSELVSESV